MPRKFKHSSVEVVEVEFDEHEALETRVMYVGPATGTQISHELDDALLDLCRGLKGRHVVDCWITLDFPDRGKPKLSFKLNVQGNRPFTPCEKGTLAAEEEAERSRENNMDEETLRRIHDRNPHLFNDYR
jgi:hypothetical protein